MSASTATALQCPACDEPALEAFLRIDGVPVITTALWPSETAARTAPRGNLNLAICTSCGLITNLDFDPALVAYTPEYEASQFFSASFRDYASALAERLVDEYGLTGKTVVEIGSGKGEFLAVLLQAGIGAGVGYDPTYAGEVDSEADGRLRFVRDYYGGDAEAADLVVCRHVLEHVPDPVTFLRMLRAAIDDRGTPLYLEVPDADFVLSGEGQWDLIYPHVSYFTAPAMRRLLARCGFDVTRISSEFGGQFLCVDATPATPPVSAADPLDETAAIVARTRSFGRAYDATRQRWMRELRAQHDAGRRLALWGAGAKGVSFLNAISEGGTVDVVVDLNTRKQGAFVPGTAQRVVAPDDLVASPPDTVLVMNPVYEHEIRARLDELDLNPDVVCV